MQRDATSTFFPRASAEARTIGPRWADPLRVSPRGGRLLGDRAGSRCYISELAIGLTQHPDENRPQRPVLLAVDQPVGEAHRHAAQQPPGRFKNGPAFGNQPSSPPASLAMMAVSILIGSGEDGTMPVLAASARMSSRLCSHRATVSVSPMTPYLTTCASMYRVQTSSAVHRPVPLRTVGLGAAVDEHDRRRDQDPGDNDGSRKPKPGPRVGAHTVRRSFGSAWASRSSPSASPPAPLGEPCPHRSRSGARQYPSSPHTLPERHQRATLCQIVIRDVARVSY